MAAANKLIKAGSEVERKEQHPPTLVLSNVNVLVKPNMSQRFVVCTDDDVTKRDGAEATIAWEH